MKLRPLVAVALLSLMAAAPAQAGQDGPYAALLAKVVAPDGNRDAQHAIGVQLTYGIPLDSGIAVELEAGSNLLRRQSDQQYDVYYHLGTALKMDLPKINGFTPFLLGGFGATREDEIYDQYYRPYADFGGGVRHRLIYNNLSLRAEARYHLVYAGSDGAKETFSDALFNIGLQMPLGKAAIPVTDSDGDGVIDGRDRCPDTPVATVVDGHGCPLSATDSDGDGVADSSDRCPSTPPGQLVDASGCLVAVPAPVVVPPPALTPMAAVDNDTDKDGVANVSDDCPDTPQGMKVGRDGCLIAQTVVLEGVQFESNSSRLTATAKEILGKVAGGLKLQPSLRLEISGHTDSLGPQTANLTLSLARAKAVEAYLVSQGVDAGHLRAEGYGEFIPVDTNETEAGRARNRRVEFKVLSTTAP